MILGDVLKIIMTQDIFVIFIYRSVINGNAVQYIVRFWRISDPLIRIVNDS